MGAYKAKTPVTASVWNVLLTEPSLHTIVYYEAATLSLGWVCCGHTDSNGGSSVSLSSCSWPMGTCLLLQSTIGIVH